MVDSTVANSNARQLSLLKYSIFDSAITVIQSPDAFQVIFLMFAYADYFSPMNQKPNWFIFREQVKISIEFEIVFEDVVDGLKFIIAL